MSTAIGMASTQIYSIAFVAVLSMISQNVVSNPVLSAQETYDSYARLVCTTDKLWRDEYQLHRDFKEDRMPGTTATPAVDVPNLLLTSDMKVSERFQSTEVDLLANHRDYLYNYKYILHHVIEDERNSTSPNSFNSDMNNILFLLSSAIADLEYTMIHLGHHSKTTSSVPETDRPSFDPQWEKNAFNRYQRDLYVLSEMEVHLQKAVQDFSSWRDRYIEISTVPYSCEQ
ncbi:uncharacterized protein [Apostichopus japonicus]|uniref:uncharacterized protein n=1 Tax=Stichopus japonicus TaxID=307972 RepID=UPI003AB7AC39